MLADVEDNAVDFFSVRKLCFDAFAAFNRESKVSQKIDEKAKCKPCQVGFAERLIAFVLLDYRVDISAADGVVFYVICEGGGDVVLFGKKEIGRGEEGAARGVGRGVFAFVQLAAVDDDYIPGVYFVFVMIAVKIAFAALPVEYFDLAVPVRCDLGIFLFAVFGKENSKPIIAQVGRDFI